MSVFKWHPLYECKHIPAKTMEQRELEEKVAALKEEGARIKKEKAKERAKFECPCIDPLTNARCPKTYASYKYKGVLTHLRTCSLRPFPGNQERILTYIRQKSISLET